MLDVFGWDEGFLVVCVGKGFDNVVEWCGMCGGK